MLFLVCSICHSETQCISSFELKGNKNVCYISRLRERLNSAFKLKIFFSISPLLQLNSAVLAKKQSYRHWESQSLLESIKDNWTKINTQTDLQIQERFFFPWNKMCIEHKNFSFLFFEFEGICIDYFIYSSFSLLVPFLSMTIFLPYNIREVLT